jgi:hypothetical protein
MIMDTRFAMIPLAALLAPNLTFRTLKVYGAICSYRKSSDDFCVEASREEIAGRCGFNASIVSTATTELQRLGWLIKHGVGGRRVGGGGLKTSYTITTPLTVPISETVAESETVLKSETVAESVSKTVLDSGTPLYRKEVNTDGRLSKPKDAEPDGFVKCWSAYPKREGGNSRSEALKAYRARLKAGTSPADLLAGVKRYAAYCQSKGWIGTSYVKQGKTFFGPDGHWCEDWGIAAALPAQEQKPKAGESRTRFGAAEVFTENLGWVPA